MATKKNRSLPSGEPSGAVSELMVPRPGQSPSAAELFAGWRWAIPLLALLVVVFFARFLFTERFFLMRDLIFDFFPRQEFYKRHLLQGVLPLWNPYTGGGEPFLSNMESGVFYPPNLLYLLLPVPTANAILVAFHVFLAGAGVWLACRAWRISIWGALLAAIAFAFSTQTVTRIEFYSFLCSYAWYPLAVAIFTMWLGRPSLRPFLLLAMIFSLQLLGGYPEAVLFTFGTLIIYAMVVGVSFWRRGSWGVMTACRPFWALAGMGLVALLLSMAQILPVLGVLPHSLRQDLDPGIEFASVDPFMFLTVFFPYLYGKVGYFGKYWAPSVFEFWLGTFYIGLVPIMLCLKAGTRVAMGERRRAPEIASDPVAALRTRVLLVVLVVSLLYAMGGYTPVFPVLWSSLPILQLFRWPAKALMCVTFALSCLAGVALDWLHGVRGVKAVTLGGWRKALTTWSPSLIWLALAGFVGYCLSAEGRPGEWLLRNYFNLNSVEEKYSHRIPWELLADEGLKFILVMLVAALLFMLGQRRPTWRRATTLLLPFLLFVDLFITTMPLLPASGMDIMDNHGPYRRVLSADLGGETRFYRAATQQYFYGSKNEDLLRLARNTIPASWPMVDGVHAIRPMGDFKLENYDQLLRVFEWQLAPPENALAMLKKLGCSVIMEPNLQPGYFEGGDFFSPGLTSLGPPPPSSFVVGRVQLFPDRESLLNAMIYGRQDTMEVALAEQGEIADPDLQGSNGFVPHTVLRHDYLPNGLEVEVVSSRPGLLVLNETFYQGWDATVNGADAEIYQVNGAFRAVKIPSGRSLVEMDYRPRTLNLGLSISLGTLLLVLGLFWTGGRLPRGKRWFSGVMVRPLRANP